MSTKTQAQRLASIESALKSLDIDHSGGKSEDLDRSILSRLYEAGIEYVNVHITREQKQGNIFSTRTYNQMIGTWARVDLKALFTDTMTWFLREVGGGSYIVELTHPEELSYGILYKFKIQVDGAPKKPVQLQNYEAQTNQQITQATGSVASALIASGIPEPQAYQMAQQIARENPLLASQLGGQNTKEEDEMAGANNMFSMMMAMQMQQAQMAAEAERRREEREEKRREEERREAREKLSRAPDPQVEELRRTNDLLRAQLEEDRRRREESERKAEIQAMNTRFEQLIKEVSNKKPDVDPTVAALSSMGNMFSGLKQSEVQQAQMAQTQQNEIMKQMFSILSSRGSEMDILTKSLLAQQEFALKKSQVEMDAPLKQAEMVSQMVGMFGGLIRAQNDIMQSMQGNPAIDALRELSGALPDLVQGLVGMDATRGRVSESLEPDITSADEAALDEEINSLREQAVSKPKLQSAPPKTEAALPDPPEQPAEPVESEYQEIIDNWAEAHKVAGEIAKALGMTGDVEAFLKEPKHVAILLKIPDKNAAPRMVAVELTDLIAEFDGVIDIDPAQLDTTFDAWGWSAEKIALFKGAFIERIKELAA